MKNAQINVPWLVHFQVTRTGAPGPVLGALRPDTRRSVSQRRPVAILPAISMAIPFNMRAIARIYGCLGLEACQWQ
jgi:hypothetical protein